MFHVVIGSVVNIRVMDVDEIHTMILGSTVDVQISATKFNFAKRNSERE